MSPVALTSSLHQRFERQVVRTPDAIALSDDSLSLSYAEVNRRANQIAHTLRSIGVGPESIVGLMLERGIHLVVAVLGILKAGGAYLPIDAACPAERARFILHDAGAELLLTNEAFKKNVAGTGVHSICLDSEAPAIARARCDDPPSNTTASNLAYIIYTSGSTGRPKGVEVTHHNVLRLFDATESSYHFNERDVWTLFHSIAFDFSVWEMWGALLHGGRLVVVPLSTVRSPQTFYEVLRSERVTVLNQTPSAFRELMAVDSERRSDLALRYVIFGGEALAMGSLSSWFDVHGDETPRLVNMYGITETTVHVTYRPLSIDDLKGGSVIGQPLADLRLHILDPQGEPVPIGTFGEIFVGGAGVARGYRARADLSATRFVPDPFSKEPGARLYRTGDLACAKADGEIEFVGRLDDQIKLRGFRIELGEIEAALLELPSVREAVAFVREYGVGDRRIVAAIVPASAPGPHLPDLRAALERTLPDHMIPAAFIVLQRLPLTANGKLDREALSSLEATLLTASSSFVSPGTPLEKAIAALWCECLRVDRVGLTDNFFELGGHSLLAIKMMSGIQDRLGVEVPFQFLFGVDVTVGEFAKEVLACQLEQGDPNWVRGRIDALLALTDTEVVAELEAEVREEIRT